MIYNTCSMYIRTIKQYSTLKSCNTHSAARQITVTTIARRSDLNPLDTLDHHTVYIKRFPWNLKCNKYQIHRKYMFSLIQDCSHYKSDMLMFSFQKYSANVTGTRHSPQNLLRKFPNQNLPLSLCATLKIQLESIILSVFSNLNDSMILYWRIRIHYK